MQYNASSYIIVGNRPIKIKISVKIRRGGFPYFKIVGLPGKQVKESQIRIFTALSSLKIKLPPLKITVNLTPSDVIKNASYFDLPIALCLLNATERYNIDLRNNLYFGELDLEGNILPTDDLAITCLVAEELGFLKITANFNNYLNKSDQSSKAIPHRNKLLYLSDLKVKLKHCTSLLRIGRNNINEVVISYNTTKKLYSIYKNKALSSLNHILNQEILMRALQISSAGGHPLLLTGPTGAGKSSAISYYDVFLPSLALGASCVVRRHNALGGRVDIMTRVTSASPHESLSQIFGWYKNKGLSKLDLASFGVLHFDEINYFSKEVLLRLRAVIDEYNTGVTNRLPLIVGTCNPCPCGNYGSTDLKCVCPPYEITRHKNRLTKPLRDRFALHVFSSGYAQLDNVPSNEQTKDFMLNLIKSGQSVEQAREMQRKRYNSSEILNQTVSSSLLFKDVSLSADASNFYKKTLGHYNLSSRGALTVLRVSRTIADLAKSVDIEANHIAEALQYRYQDKL